MLGPLAQLAEQLTLNQQVTGSSPVRLTENPIRNDPNIPPLVAKLVNNGLPLLLTKFLNSRRQGISPRTIQFYEFCLEPFVNSYQLTTESINKFLSLFKLQGTMNSLTHPTNINGIHLYFGWVTEYQGIIND